MTASPDDTANAAKDRRTLSEVACDLIVVEHRLRALRRWTPEGTTGHLDAALANVSAGLDSMHAEHHATAAEHWDDATHRLITEAADLPDVLIRDGALVCPHCEQDDSIVEEDAAERWNPVRLGVGGAGIHVSQGDATFETTGWRCDACGKAVAMPEALAQNASWS